MPTGNINKDMYEDMLNLLKRKSPLEEMGIRRDATIYVHPDVDVEAQRNNINLHGVGMRVEVSDLVPKDGVFFVNPLPRTMRTVEYEPLDDGIRYNIGISMQRHFDRMVASSMGLPAAYFESVAAPQKPIPVFVEDWRDDPEERWKYQKQTMLAVVSAPVNALRFVAKVFNFARSEVGK